MRWLVDLLRGGGDELGFDDLVRRATLAIAGLARHAERGRLAFPEDVVVRVEVGEGSVAVVRAFVEQPELDAAVGAALANECDCASEDLPVREYVVASGPKTRVTAAEGSPRAWRVSVEGGDLDGRAMTLPRSAREVRFGRGEWHGPDRTLRNDLVVCERTEFVSRRAGRLLAAGRALEVESLDQGDALSVRREDGGATRPARTAKGSVALRDGDVIELSDGKARVLRLRLRSVRQGEADGADHP